MGNKKESFIFVLAPIKGVFWHFKVERPRSLSYTVASEQIYKLNLPTSECSAKTESVMGSKGLSL